MNDMKPLTNGSKSRTNGCGEIVVLLRMIINNITSKHFCNIQRIRKQNATDCGVKYSLIPYIMDIQEIYIENRQMVFHHVLSIVKDYHDSEEVTNNVFLKMFRLECANYNKKHGTALTSWIRTITNHQILDYFRTNHQEHYMAVSDFVREDEEDNRNIFNKFISPKTDQADNEVLNGEIKSKINKAIENLDIKYRRVAILYFLWEYEYSEIADILSVPMGTVKGMLSRSRAKLQDSLKDAYMLRKAVAVA
jgi:RNA polymerase sigma-70 factor (ECF subfamily)